MSMSDNDLGLGHDEGAPGLWAPLPPEVRRCKSRNNMRNRTMYVTMNSLGDKRTGSPSDQKDHPEHSPSEKPELRYVFGDSDEDEAGEYGARNELEQDSHRSPLEEEGSDKNLRPEDVVSDEGPALDLEIPLRPPPGYPDKMNMSKVSNIMGVEHKPFDPKTCGRGCICDG
ncbi:hypothetical protein QJS10_CPB17g01963 [Acorus calamus]|uniref:Uncharacterized protein n=1 Tax=Acorus calamus TaxID=4465 RepID=A0AAV9CVF3_ACOCL|nr:hypothetical protein QJS10_CPB17g01963 [Acorus calamus]